MVRIRWNIRAFEEIRRSAGVANDLGARADRIAAAADEGYVAHQGQGRTRARASVVTATGAAIRDNASHNTLLRAIDAGR